MLKTRLIHPELLEALASAGHGSRVLVADGNYPGTTAKHPAARLVHLNLAPGLLTVDQVLEVLLTAITVEAAVVMGPDDGSDVEAHAAIRSRLGGDVPIERTDRWSFYDLARSPELAVVVATGDVRPYGNVVLTIGLP